jgi:hypothetical protein
MPWPDWVLEKFNTIPGGMHAASRESDFYGPYNTLLYYLFPPQDHYMVVPQYQRPPAGSSIDFTTIFVVRQTQTQTPIFYLEIKPPLHYYDISTREAADTQMRDRVRELIGALQIPKLHGVSALGTRLAFYQYDAATRTLEPAAILRDPIRVNDTAPQERWDVNLLEDAGVLRLELLVANIKAMCQAIV